MAKKITFDELQQQVVNFQDVISSIGDGISIQDTDFNILYQNQVHENMIGEHLGKHCFKAYENNENVCNECPLKQTFLDGNIHTAERSAEVDGEMLYVEIASSPLRSASGEIIAGIESVRNITKRKKAKILLDETLNNLDQKIKERTAELEREVIERRQAEATLRESEERWKIIVQSQPECVKLLDKEGCLLEMNPAGLSMIQSTFDQVRGKRMRELVVPEDRGNFDAMLSSVFNGETESLEFDIVGLEGNRLTLETTSAPLWKSDKKDKVKALLGVTRDITDRKRAEEEKDNLESQLRQAYKMEAIGTIGWRHSS